jgi:hypothetical protein
VLRELTGERLTGRLDRVVARLAALDEDAPKLCDPEAVILSDLPLEAVEGSDGGTRDACALLVEHASVAGACEPDAGGLRGQPTWVQRFEMITNMASGASQSRFVRPV